MTIAASQIIFLLSGGTSNSNPSRSIGGPPSTFPVLGTLNNLFSDVTSDEATSGKTDFRCFYVKNNSSNSYLYDVECFIDSQASTGSTAEVGAAIVTDVQNIEVRGPVTGGNLVLKYEQTEFAAEWGGSPQNFLDNLLLAMQGVGLNGVGISTSFSGISQNFIVEFKGFQDKRNHQKMVVSENNLVGAVSVSISKVAEGQPINSNGPLLAAETVPPSKVNFYTTNQRISLGNLRPGDFVPVWIKRTTVANTDFKENDYFVFKILGKPFGSGGQTPRPTSTPMVTPWISGLPAPTLTQSGTGPTPTPSGTGPTPTPSGTGPTPTPSASCLFIECGGVASYADCGLIQEAGYSYSMDCNLCRCVKSLVPTLTPSGTGSTPTPTRTPTPSGTGPTPTPSKTGPTPTPTPTASCLFIECGGTLAYADCGMLNETGYSYSMDCNSCECVKSPVPTQTVSCAFIECGGTLASADCGLANEPGYTYSMDCDLCKCIKSPVPTPTAS